MDRSHAPEPGPAPEIRIRDYKSFELKNGLKVFLVENHKLPLVNYSLILDIDPFTEGDSIGYSTFAGELLGTATTSRTKDQIDEEIDYIGATITTGSASMYGASLKKHNETLLDLMSDILLNPVFKEEELEKVRKQAISALSFNKNDPATISEDVLNVLLFGKDHPYGEIMTEASVNSITTEMCENYYRTWVRPNIAYLAIVGDLTLREAKKLVKKYFGKWEAGDVPSFKYPDPSAPSQPTMVIVDRPHAVQSVIKVGYPVDLTIGDEDYIKARVMNTVLGGGSYRLYNNLREDHGYTYGAYSMLNQDRYIGNFQATTDVRNEVTDSAIYQILYEMERLRREPVPEKELDMVKNYLSGTFALALENPSTVARFALNTALYNLPRDYYASYLRSIAAVSSEDIHEIARTYIKPDSVYILVVGKSDQIAENLAQFNPDKQVRYYDAEGNYIDPSTLEKALPEGLAAGDVVEKYLEAIGGRRVLEAIEDLEIKIALEMQGMPIQMEIYQKRPDLYKMTMLMNGNILSMTAYNGETGRISGMQGEQVLAGDDLESLKSQAQFMPELDYKGKGYATRLVSIESVEGVETYMIEIKDPAGGLGYDFYSIETGLKIREDIIQETPDGEVVQSTLLSDYREVDGILYPHKLSMSFGPQSLNGTVELVRFNKGMDTSVFE
jgi:predicted Zn-dependent peptidase